MSYSFRIPEEDPICECRWDEARQRMDRDDCPFHADLPDELLDENDSVLRIQLPSIDTEALLPNQQPRSNNNEIAEKKKAASNHCDRAEAC